jgi:hypothetical protein
VPFGVDPRTGEEVELALVIRGGQSRPLFTASALPSDPEGWQRFRKREPTKLVRVCTPDGAAQPFVVEVPSGEHVYCADGYLAVDARGLPYPVDREEVEMNFEEVGA